MKILYICRLYSGFEQSLKEQSWQPNGAPTIARMIEYLDSDSNIELSLVMTCKDFGSNWTSTDNQILNVDGLKTPIHVLPGKNALPKWLWKFQEKFNNLKQLTYIWRLYKQTQPDLIYCDRVNVLPAAIFAKYTKAPVIWRVMGILKDMHSMLKQQTIRSKFFKALWKSPFSAILCTRDGSEGELWLEQAANQNTEKHMLINGYEPQTDDQTVDLPQNNKTKILFAGRIEHLKGLDILLDTANLLKTAQNNEFEFVMAGYGTAEDWLKSEIKKRSLEEYFTFLGGLSPEQMKYARKNCQISLSCGTHGNLTNTVIEALSDGMCVIIPKADTEQGVDIEVNQFITQEAAVRYGLQKDAQGLADTLLYLQQTPEKVISYQKEALAFAQENFPSWDERIQQEFQIFQNIVASQNDQS